MLRGDHGNDRFNVVAMTTQTLLYRGIGNDDFHGGYQVSAASNVYGEAGNDSFLYFRGPGWTLHGAIGNDTYLVDATGSANFVELADEGTDLVYVARGQSYTLGAHLEYLTARGYSGSTLDTATLTGNALNNTIRGHNNNETINGLGGNDILRGNGGNDTLNGGEGNDRLEGGLSDNTMTGGIGDDTYFVDSGADMIVEQSFQGTDTARYTINGTLADNVENGVLLGTSDLFIGGNALDNILYGNSGNNGLMIGGDGEDTIYGGGGGNDGLIGDGIVIGSSGGYDVLDGGEGDDNILGGETGDTLTGGAGSDTFFYRDIRDSTAIDTDFQSINGPGGDAFNLSQMDANIAVAGDRAFTYTAGTATANSFWFSNAVNNGDGTFEVTMNADFNGDTTAELVIQVHFIGNLWADDIIL